jgi:hypothetical protein
MNRKTLLLRFAHASICALFLSGIAANPQTISAEPGYSIRLLHSTPKPGTRLVAGEHVSLSVTVAYKLSAKDNGVIALVLQKGDSSQLTPGRDQIKTQVHRGGGEVTLTDEFDVPTGTSLVRLFVPLMPDGYAHTSGEIVIEYPVKKK